LPLSLICAILYDKDGIAAGRSIIPSLAFLPKGPDDVILKRSEAGGGVFFNIYTFLLLSHLSIPCDIIGLE
jgi:hypothetical protein